MEQRIPAGTIVKIGGFPFELTEDSKAESATSLETALNSQGAKLHSHETGHNAELPHFKHGEK